MTYCQHTNAELFFVRWLSPEPADLNHILEAVRSQRSALARRLIYVSILDTEIKPPGETFVRRMIALLPELIDELDRLYLVITLGGISGALHRRVLAAGLRAARAKDPERANKTRICADLDQAFSDAGIVAARRANLAAELQGELFSPG